MKPIVEGLLEDVDQNKQRAAAEMLAGVLGGMKHWPQTKQEYIWKWVMPLLEKALSSNLKPDTLPVWTSFFEVRSYALEPLISS
jgi:proteasome activator subunit 4